MNKTVLSNINIDSTARETEAFLKKNQIPRENIIRLVLSMEEILLKYRDRFGEEKEYTFETGKRFGVSYVSVSIPGEAFNPAKEENDDWSLKILADMGLAPLYSYRKGVNKVTIYLKKIISSSRKYIIAATAAACLTGGAGKLFFADHTEMLRQMLVIPVLDSLMGLFMLAAVPMIFISILYGTGNMDNLSELKKAGNGMMYRFISKTFLMTFIAGLFLLPFFSFDINRTMQTSLQVTTSLNLLTDILPRDLLNPFIQGNTLQIVFVAMVLGIITVALGERGKTIRKLTAETNGVVYLFMEWVSKLIPEIMFLIILKALWGNNNTLLRLWKPLLVTFAVCFTLPFIHAAIIGLKTRTNTISLIRKLLPSYVVAYTTMSSAASYGANLECCERKLGISRNLTNMGIPVGMVMFKPTTSIFFLICIMFGFETSGISCSIPMLLYGCITATLLSIAIPPIPGGAITGFTFLFSQMGIPADLGVLAIAMDTIIDRYSTACNITTLKLELLRQADRQKQLDRKKLERGKK